MKKKGFTLVELLGVIVVLAIIALIAVPTIMGVVDKAKKGSLQDSAYGLIEAADLYYAQYLNGKTVRFDIEDNKITTEEKNKLNYKGTIKSGTVLINKKGQVTVCINDGKHAAYKNYQDTKVTVVDKKTCTVPESSYIVYLDDEATITEMTNQELTDAVTNLIEQVNILKQENAQLKQQVNNKSDSTQVSTLQLRHDNDITSIWNKVGTEDLSSISDGSISQILIDNNKLVSDLQTLVNGKVDATVTNNLSSQISTLNSTISSQATQINNLSTALNGKANSSDLSKYATSSSLETLQSTVNNHTTYINAKLDKSTSRDDATGGIMQYREYDDNANYMLNSGIYRIVPDTECMPVTGYGVLMVINATYNYGSNGEAWIKQIYFPNSAPEIFYVRENINYSATSWTAWKKFKTETTDY